MTGGFSTTPDGQRRVEGSGAGDEGHNDVGGVGVEELAPMAATLGRSDFSARP
jgi:hypothetical protein